MGQSIRSAGPYIVLVSGEQAERNVGWHPLFHTKPRYGSIAKPHNTQVVGREPKRAAGVIVSSPYPNIFRKTWINGFRITEADSVETHQACLRAEPQEAVMRLPDIVNRACGKPLLERPDAMHVLCKSASGIQRDELGREQTGGARQQQQGQAALHVSILASIKS